VTPYLSDTDLPALPATRPPLAGGPASAANSPFAQDLLAALGSRPRSISPKYFYDAAGSALFDRICQLPEYYPTRTECALLQAHAADIADLAGPGAEIVEFGAGSLRKVRILLDALEAPAGYLPIDISGEHLLAAAAELRASHPALEVRPVVADYTAPMSLPAPPGGAGRRIGFFPGSTIGNFTPAEARAFLRSAASVLRGGALLVGADLVKDPAVLHAAYNDAQGVTAAFNRNLLVRANAELGTDFDPQAFDHAAFYNAPLQRIEMHLVSRTDQQVTVCGQPFGIAAGETLHTENSHKFTLASLRDLAASAGFSAGPSWVDAQGLFSLHWLVAPAH
jgi:dimethylhistidine N-methyltransferase